MLKRLGVAFLVVGTGVAAVWLIANDSAWLPGLGGDGKPSSPRTADRTSAVGESWQRSDGLGRTVDAMAGTAAGILIASFDAPTGLVTLVASDVARRYLLERLGEVTGVEVVFLDPSAPLDLMSIELMGVSVRHAFDMTLRGLDRVIVRSETASDVSGMSEMSRLSGMRIHELELTSGDEPIELREVVVRDEGLRLTFGSP